MASWTLPYRVEAVDRDPSFYWQDLDDGPNDFFGEFINFDVDANSSSSMTNPLGHDPSLPTMPDGLLLDQPSESTISSGVSTIEDEFDFLSSSSQVGGSGHPMSAGAGAAHHELDPRQLSLAPDDNNNSNNNNAIKTEGMPRISVSDPELPRVDGICLHSPSRRMPVSQPSSPTPPSTVVAPRKPNKFVEALSSTLRKAGKLRKGRSRTSASIGVVEDHPGSPTMDNPPRALRIPPAFPYPPARPSRRRRLRGTWTREASYTGTLMIHSVRCLRHFQQSPSASSTLTAFTLQPNLPSWPRRAHTQTIWHLRGAPTTGLWLRDNNNTPRSTLHTSTRSRRPAPYPTRGPGPST